MKLEFKFGLNERDPEVISLCVDNREAAVRHFSKSLTLFFHFPSPDMHRLMVVMPIRQLQLYLIKLYDASCTCVHLAGWIRHLYLHLSLNGHSR